jgi:hypothetical protein
MIDRAFSREARKFIERSAKRNPDLFRLAGPREQPLCVATIIAVPPDNRYGSFVATDGALYTWTPNGPDHWVRTPWEFMKGLLISSHDRGMNISLVIGLREHGAGVERWMNGKREWLEPGEVARLVAAGVTILDPFLFNNSTHLRECGEGGLRHGATPPEQWSPSRLSRLTHQRVLGVRKPRRVAPNAAADRSGDRASSRARTHVVTRA